MYLLRRAQILHKGLEGGALHAADAHGSDLLLVGQDAHGSALWGLGLIDRLQLCVGAHPVVVAVAADERAVQAHVAGVKGGDDLQLRGEEILLDDPVAVMEQGEHGQLHPILALVGVGDAADEQAQTFGRYEIGGGLAHLVFGQVGE